MKCLYCGSTMMRTSRLRLADIPRLFLFQYPVRCRFCHERYYVGFVTGLNLRQAEKIRHQEDRNRRRARPIAAPGGDLTSKESSSAPGKTSSAPGQE
jgi:hypothetical protein